MARAEIEWWSGGIRVWDDDDAEYGDCYQYCASVVWSERGVYEVKLVLDAPTPSHWRAMVRELQRQHVRQAIWDRIRPDGTTDRRTVNIKPIGE